MADQRRTVSVTPSIDNDALLCALVLAPNTYSRNRFFHLYETPAYQRTRKRARRVRSIVRQLLGHGREPAEIVGLQVLDDRVLLRFQVRHLNYLRTTSLSLLEGALVQYALHKAMGHPLDPAAAEMVETALARLSSLTESAQTARPSKDA